jgi:hypothetical protein
MQSGIDGTEPGGFAASNIHAVAALSARLIAAGKTRVERHPWQTREDPIILNIVVFVCMHTSRLRTLVLTLWRLRHNSIHLCWAHVNVPIVGGENLGLQLQLRTLGLDNPSNRKDTFELILESVKRPYARCRVGRRIESGCQFTCCSLKPSQDILRKP